MKFRWALLVTFAHGLVFANEPLRTWGVEEPVETPPRAKDESTPATEPDSQNAADDASQLSLVEPARYVIERIEVDGNDTTLYRVVRRFVSFKEGDRLDVNDPELERTRFRLLATGFFREVRLSLRRGSRRGRVVLAVTVSERSTILVNDIWLGLSADAEPNGAARPLTAYGGIDVSETNLAGTGTTLGGALALAERQTALRARFALPDVLPHRIGLETQLLYSNAKDFFGQRDVRILDPLADRSQDFAIVGYQRFGGLIGLSTEAGSLDSHLFFDYRLERINADFPSAATHRRGTETEPIDFYIRRDESILSTVRATFLRDTRDVPNLPTRGTHLSTVLELAPPKAGDYAFAKLVGRGSIWAPLPWGHIVRLEGFVGAIAGDAPLFERFYVGDFTDFLPDRILDLAVDRRAPPNFLHTAVAEVRYGTYAARVQGEYRVPIYRGTRSILGIDLYGAAGLYGVATPREFTSPASGYGGLRKVPVDMTFNFGLRLDTSVGGFGVGVSTLLGFVPVRQVSP